MRVLYSYGTGCARRFVFEISIYFDLIIPPLPVSIREQVLRKYSYSNTRVILLRTSHARLFFANYNDASIIGQ